MEHCSRIRGVSQNKFSRGEPHTLEDYHKEAYDKQQKAAEARRKLDERMRQELYEVI